ncbi:MAG: Gfo/Idh/MocA family oxidoreductase [Bryobacteraceae bacterium]
MDDAPSYAILGRGRWAGKMRGILAGQDRRTAVIEETKRRPAESDGDYKARLMESMLGSAGQIVWICVPPGPHIPLMIEAAIAAGLHAVVEKPWQCSRSQTDSLLAIARPKRLLIAIHYEYCFLEGLRRWRDDFNNTPGLRFGGQFTVNRPDRLGIPAIDNLGCHLLAIRAYAVPHAELSGIYCGYELPDERRVWVEKNDREIASIDFLGNNEPLIQRFILGVENTLTSGDFPFDLCFASRVSEEIDVLKRK